MSEGVKKAWALLRERDPREALREAGVIYANDGEGACEVSSMGMSFRLHMDAQMIEGLSSEADAFYSRHRLFFEHSALWAAAVGRGVGRTGRLLKPSDIKGGHHFFTRGTHVLPLDDIADKYGSDPDGFRQAAMQLGGREVSYGDVAYEFMPLHALPVTVILWLGDDEFAPRADLLLDASAEYVAPLDVIWSAVMLVVKGICDE